ncbi:MAG: hypothetical protein AAGH46_09920, partial [Bacteroidota bacterium]
LYNVDINKNAEVIQYSRGSDGELIGINKSKSGSINIKLVNSDIEVITLINRPDGEITPESQFPKNANKLRGFDWRESEKPNSVEDLFSAEDDLDLPIIKGKAIPNTEEDFFDEDLIERVESAQDPNDEQKENKSARNIPVEYLKSKDSIKLKKPKRLPTNKPKENN